MTQCYNCRKPKRCDYRVRGEPICESCKETLAFCGLPVKEA